MPQPSTVETGVRDASGGRHGGHTTATPEMCHLSLHTAPMPWIRQVPTEDIDMDIQDAEHNVSNVKPIPGPVGTIVNTIGYANTAMNQLDTIASTYLQPLSNFNAVVTSIGNVCPSK